MLIHLFESSLAMAQSVPPLPDTAPVVHTGLLTFLQTNASLIFAVLWGLAETLALIPSIKSNSVFTLVFNALNSLKGMFTQTPKV